MFPSEKKIYKKEKKNIYIYRSPYCVGGQCSCDIRNYILALKAHGKV